MIRQDYYKNDNTICFVPEPVDEWHSIIDAAGTPILTNLYKDLVKTHVDKNYRLGIDSFHFQNKLMQMEYDNMKNISGFIDNRIYCEYYKFVWVLFFAILMYEVNTDYHKNCAKYILSV